ncbi:hypothetical protein [Dyadobacter sp. MSC1_007]|jgi:hypothetical protein|uniref:hypothetical protein n=1 Tax=Dyadobacter sp. MSC1_007 TaxID=2909264 RepID=UPI00202E7CDA|nr:hypothetical protein [Dyadobacter sp. MSC1_007]
MEETLQQVCTLLDDLSETILNASSEDRTFAETQGWNWPSVNRYDLANMPSKLSECIKKVPINVDEDLREELDQVCHNINTVKSQTVPYIFNGHGQQAIPAFVSTMAAIRSVFEPLLGWQVLSDNKAMPTQLARRLRGIEADLTEITPKKEELQNQIKLIQNAVDAAETLPTDLQTLKEARGKVDTYTTDSAGLYAKIETFFKDSETSAKSIKEKNEEADKIVQQCEEAYRITTSKGLAAAFDERAGKSSNSMWVWVIGLIIALVVGSLIGTARVKLLSDAVSSTNPQWSIISMHIVLSIISIGAPLWFAWLATKQINQRFRLSEDYAFKASVAKAYEGYRREAARIDPAFEARLFSSALTRLEEAPLRLVESDTHGSPWHELFASKPFQNALEVVPNLKDKFVEVAKEGISVFKKDNKVFVTAETEEENA